MNDRATTKRQAGTARTASTDLAARPSPDAMVDEIVALMQAGAWRAGQSHREMMAAWGVSRPLVDRYAAEAGRAIRRAVGSDPDAIVGAYLARLESISERADTVGDFAPAIRAIEIQAKLLRLVDPSKPSAPPAWASLTAEQRLERIAAARVQLDALEHDARAELATSADEQPARASA